MIEINKNKLKSFQSFLYGYDGNQKYGVHSRFIDDIGNYLTDSEKKEIEGIRF